MLLSMQLKDWRKKQPMMLSDYLNAKNIIFLEETNRDDAIATLVSHLCKNQSIDHQELFYHSVIDREKIVSTGIGRGVAIPHAKMDLFDDFVIAIGIHKDQGIEWNSLDKNPVKVVFLIGGPALDQKKYLKILSHLTNLLKEERFHQALFFYKDPEELLKVFRHYDRFL